MRIRFSLRILDPDCHSQCAHWLRNDKLYLQAKRTVPLGTVLLNYSKNYLPMFIWAATSAAKSSCFFSMPSPVAKRTAFTNFTEPPSFLAASAM